MKNAFYPGAGLDIIPPSMFRHIKKWFYMDSQPNSEFGSKLCKEYYRPDFISQLIDVMENAGFRFQDVQNNTHVFYNAEYSQLIVYETNAIFPDHLKPEYLTCDTLVLCGYKLTNPPLNFIGSYSHIITDSNTVHELVDESVLFTKNVSTIIMHHRNKNNNIINRFLSYDELHYK
jgi:hypothetical protein